MPITRNAKKALRVASRKHDINLRTTKVLKENIKAVEKALHNKQSTTDLAKNAFSAIDKAAKKGIIKKNTASRRKSKVSRMITRAETK